MNTINKTTTAYVASMVAASNKAKLFGLVGYNSKGSDQFLQIHDAASLPADGAIPKIVFKIRSGDNFSLDYDALGRVFNTGIVICNSSTANTLTIGSADIWLDVQVSGLLAR